MTAVEEAGNQQPTSTEKVINLDFGAQRRHSFLPDNWDEKRFTNIKNIGVLEVHEDDDLFMIMQGTSDNIDKPLRKFCTGSVYLGQWNKLGIAGKGVYKYPHGVIYDGYFNKDGQFHGAGILIYPNGHRIEGTWKNGRLGPDCNYIAKGGVIMNKSYCLMPDRRFQVECEHDFNPVGQEYLTDQEPPARDIPPGCYDLVEGFYDPNIKTVIGYPTDKMKRRSTLDAGKARIHSATRYLFSGDETRRSALSEVNTQTASELCLARLMQRRGFEERKVVSWIPSAAQENWIIKNCRKAWDESVGYRPDLYEDWTKGGKNQDITDPHEIDSKYQLHQLELREGITPTKTSKRFVSFVQNVHDSKDPTVDMLTKMFKKINDEVKQSDIKIPPASNVLTSEYSLVSAFNAGK